MYKFHFIEIFMVNLTFTELQWKFNYLCVTEATILINVASWNIALLL